MSVESVFGKPIAKVSLVDGMAMGYLSTVDYRLMCDNINWDEVNKLAKMSMTVKDLNKRLFVPQRDYAVIMALKLLWLELNLQMFQLKTK